MRHPTSILALAAVAMIAAAASSSAATLAEVKERGNILIAITEANQVWIDRRQVDVRSVRANIERLRAENPEGAVVIQADKNSKNGLLVKVMDAARQAGVENVSLAATQAE